MWYTHPDRRKDIYTLLMTTNYSRYGIITTNGHIKRFNNLVFCVVLNFLNLGNDSHSKFIDSNNNNKNASQVQKEGRRCLLL